MKTEHSISNRNDVEICEVVKDSFQEYENHHSLVLFCHGCNMACPGCYNYEQVTRRENILGHAIELMDKHLTPMHEAVVFLGGEPTIWKSKLIDALEHAKQSGMLTKVYTNGMMPRVVLEASETGFVDSWAIDIKCVSDARATMGRNMSDKEYLQNIRISVAAALNYDIPVELRSVKWSWVNVKQLKAFVKAQFPGIPHIISEDFRIKSEHFKEEFNDIGENRNNKFASI